MVLGRSNRLLAKLFLTTVFFQLNQVSAQPACGDSDPVWRSCITDDDCVVAEGVCSSKGVFNKRFLAEIAKYNVCVNLSTKCGTPKKDKDEPEMKPICRSQNCMGLVKKPSK